MMILDQLKQELRQAITSYQSCRSSEQGISEIRAKDIADLIFIIDESNSAFVLKNEIISHLSELKVGSFSLWAWFDLNDLRNGIKAVLKKESYGLVKLLIEENREMRDKDALCRKEIASLRTELSQLHSFSPESVEMLRREVDSLRNELENQGAQYERIRKENEILLQEIKELRNSCELYQNMAKDYQQKFNALHEKYMSLLQENFELRNQSLSTTIDGSKHIQESSSSRSFWQKMGWSQ